MAIMQPGEERPLIEVKDLVKYYPVRSGVFDRAIAWVKAVDGVSFSIHEGETLGLVGESGCGKSTLGQTILYLDEPTSGSVFFEGTNVFTMGGDGLKELRRKMQIIFQDPFSSLDPRMPVGKAISEGLRIHRIGSSSEQADVAKDLLRRVGLEEIHAKRYPHEFSGGQRQRIGIARALALKPKFIVADEPVSALDASIQAQILNILRGLQREYKLTILFIAHNMTIVEHISDRVAVMYLGRIVEMASREEIFLSPLHPYTQALMSAIPVPDPKVRKLRSTLHGEVSSPSEPPTGCRFHLRCPVVMDRCNSEDPKLIEVSPGHRVACWRVD